VTINRRLNEGPDSIDTPGAPHPLSLPTNSLKLGEGRKAFEIISAFRGSFSLARGCMQKTLLRRQIRHQPSVLWAWGWTRSGQPVSYTRTYLGLGESYQARSHLRSVVFFFPSDSDAWVRDSLDLKCPVVWRGHAANRVISRRLSVHKPTGRTWIPPTHLPTIQSYSRSMPKAKEASRREAGEKPRKR
jgi:hypothetical protein